MQCAIAFYANYPLEGPSNARRLENESYCIYKKVNNFLMVIIVSGTYHYQLQTGFKGIFLHGNSLRKKAV